MTIFKKSIALLISIFIGAANLQVYAQKQYTDIVDTKYYEAASFFEDLGIIKGLTPEEFKPDVGISRAEFAIMLAAILGFETEGLNIALPFSDVQDENPAKQAIEYLYQWDIMIGMSETEFVPNEGITYRHAAKAVMLALGYRIFIENENEYISEIVNSGIAKGMALDDRTVTRGDACLMLFRSLTTPLVEASYTGTGVSYTKNNSKTVLSEYLHAAVHTGVVTATENCYLYGDWDIGENKIVIDYTEYQCSLVGRDAYVGHTVKYYVQEDEDNGTDKIIAIFDKSKFSEIISYQDILPTSGIRQIEYTRNKKTIRKYTGNDTYFVYNGMPAAQTLTDDMIVPAYGEVEIIDHENDGTIDVLIIRDFDVYWVDSVSKSTGIVKFKNTDFSLSGEENTYFMRDGIRIDLSEINRNDVAMVLASADNSQTGVFVNTQTVTGAVTGIIEDENIVKIAETKYQTTPFLKGIGLNTSAEFYLDCYGRIAFWKEKKDFLYGWFIKFIDDYDASESVFLKMFSENGVTENIKTKNKVKLYHGNRNIGSVVNYDLDKFLSREQMVKYKVNASGEITDIYQFEEKSSGDFGCDGFVRNIVSTGRCYFHAKGYINDQYNPKEKSVLLDDSTIIFHFRNEDAPEDWKIAHLSDWKASDYYERMQVFDISEYGIASCILVYETEYQTFMTTDPMVLVEDINIVLNEENEPEYLINGIMHKKGEQICIRSEDMNLLSNPTAVAVQKNVSLSSIKRGDIIQCHVDKDNNLISWRLLNKADEPEERAYFLSSNSETATGTEYSGLVFFGDIYRVSDSVFSIDSKILAKKRAYKFIDTDNQVLLKYHAKTGRTERMDKSEIYAGMQMYLYAQPESGYIFMVAYE